MCGRFTLIHSTEEIVETFSVEEVLFTPRVSYNVAPGQVIAAIVNGGRRKLVGFRWGLIPPWNREPDPGRGLINARAETVFSKPSFRRAFREFRCLIPVSGFYEWRKAGKKSLPHYIYMKDRSPFAIAGIYEKWVAPGGETVVGCALITVEANELLREVHDRMPAVIPPESYGLWLSPESDERVLLELLRPYPEEGMARHPVSPAVNSPRIDTPSCIEPITD